MYQYYGNLGQAADTSSDPNAASSQKVVSVTPYAATAGSFDITTSDGGGGTSASCWPASMGTPPAVGATMTNSQWNNSPSGSCASQSSSGFSISSLMSGNTKYMTIGGVLLLLVIAGFFIFHKK